MVKRFERGDPPHQTHSIEERPADRRRAAASSRLSPILAIGWWSSTRSNGDRLAGLRSAGEHG